MKEKGYIVLWPDGRYHSCWMYGEDEVGDIVAGPDLRPLLDSGELILVKAEMTQVDPEYLRPIDTSLKEKLDEWALVVSVPESFGVRMENGWDMCRYFLAYHGGQGMSRADIACVLYGDEDNPDTGYHGLSTNEVVEQLTMIAETAEEIIKEVEAFYD